MGENNFSEKEKDIENAIKVMLKGVAEHTAVSEIRAKLQKAADEDRPLTRPLPIFIWGIPWY